MGPVAVLCSLVCSLHPQAAFFITSGSLFCILIILPADRNMNVRCESSMTSLSQWIYFWTQVCSAMSSQRFFVSITIGSLYTRQYVLIVPCACANNRVPSLLLRFVSLVNILNSFDVKGFCMGLKWPYSGQENKSFATTQYFLIVSRACANNRFPSLLLLIVSLVNILRSGDAICFCLGLKWSKSGQENK